MCVDSRSQNAPYGDLQPDGCVGGPEGEELADPGFEALREILRGETKECRMPPPERRGYFKSGAWYDKEAFARCIGASSGDPSEECSVAGCGEPVHSQGVCAEHYAKRRKLRGVTRGVCDPVRASWARWGVTEPPPIECSVEENGVKCGKRTIARGLCARHYERLRCRRIAETERAARAPRICPVCKQPFQWGKATSGRRKYCSEACNQLGLRRGKRTRGGRPEARAKRAAEYQARKDEIAAIKRAAEQAIADRPMIPVEAMEQEVRV